MEEKKAVGTGRGARRDKISNTTWMIANASKESIEELLKKVPKKRETVSDMILRRQGELGMSVEVMSELAGLSRATGYKILNGQMRAKRDVLIRLAFVLEFDCRETAQFLKNGMRAALTAESRRDTAIIYGLVNGLTLGEMDIVLEELKEPLLVPLNTRKNSGE